MKLCFFCFATGGQRGKLRLARELIASADTAGRQIWFFRPPVDCVEKKRYKIELLRGNLLPEADKYIYLDCDSLMLKHGDWESDKVFGARLERPRSHHLNFKDEESREHFIHLTKTNAKQEANTGVVVVSAEERVKVAERWQYWCDYVDALLSKRSQTRDQFHFRFVRYDLDIGELPKEYNCYPTCGEEPGEFGAIHAHYTAWPRSKRWYYPHMERVVGPQLELMGPTDGFDNTRWRVIANYILLYAENPTYPVGAEVGVCDGKNAKHLLSMFPGLKLYAIDPWEFKKEQRNTAPHFYERWQNVKKQYEDRIVEMRCHSIDADVPEKLDFVFIDADHRSPAVEQDIRYWIPKIKKGGFIIGHDLDYRGTYYGGDSVRKGVEAVFGNDFHASPDRTWWKRL